MKLRYEVFLSHSLAQALKMRRQQLGLTQADVAKKAGMSQHRLSTIENGYHDTSLKVFERVATALNVKLRIEIQENTVSDTA